MQWVVGILGGVVGGSFALFSGWIAGYRTRRDAEHDRIRLLGAHYTSSAGLLLVTISRAETARSNGHDTESSWQRVQDHESVLAAVSAELEWLTHGTEIHRMADELDRELEDLVGDWGLTTEPSVLIRVRVADDKLKLLMDELEAFARRRVRERERYLKNWQSGRRHVLDTLSEGPKT